MLNYVFSIDSCIIVLKNKLFPFIFVCLYPGSTAVVEVDHTKNRMGILRCVNVLKMAKGDSGIIERHLRTAIQCCEQLYFRADYSTIARTIHVYSRVVELVFYYYFS